MKIEQSINSVIQNIPDINTNDISDGFHTFGELYEHRIRLFITLCNWNMMYADASAWVSQLHSDGSKCEGWFIMGIGREKGEQISYHLPMSYWGECSDFASVLPQAPEFDGHTSADVLKRLETLI